MAIERYIDLQLIKPLSKGSGNKGKISLTQLFKEYFDKLNVGYLDPCCPEGSPSAFGCPAISPDENNTLECRPNGLYTTGGGTISAINGLSVNSGNTVLGQDNNEVGNPAALTSNRQIPMEGNHLAFTSGSMSLNYSTPPTSNFLNFQVAGTIGAAPEAMGYPTQGLLSNLHGTAYVMHGGSNWGLVIGRLDNTLSAANITFYRSSGTNASVRGAIGAGTTIGRLNFHGVTSDASAVATAASIVVQVAATGTNFVAGNIQFITTTLAGANFLSAVLTANGNFILDGNSIDNESKLNVRQTNIGANAYKTAQFQGDWNTTGTPTLISGNITDTASNAASLLLDLQVGGSSVFKIGKTIPEYADNTAATGAGLTAGTIYRTADALKIVH